MQSFELGQTVIIIKGEKTGTVAKVNGFSFWGCKLVNAETGRRVLNGNMCSFDESWLKKA